MALPDPATRAGAAGLAALLAEPARALLCCDYDGTLAPIVLHPADAAADPAAVAALNRLAGQLARVVVLTGRPAEVAVRLGGLAAVPRLLVLGHYGLERWYDGRLASPEPDPGVARARARLPALPPGVTVEDKRLSFVVHTRPAPDPAATLAGLDGPLRALAAAEGLEVVDGSYARELRPRGTDKGSALLALAEEFQPSAVLAVGDDDGDLPVLDAVATLRAGGLPGLVVCVARPGGSEALRQRADLVVEGVAGVAAFLDSLSAAIGSAA